MSVTTSQTIARIDVTRAAPVREAATLRVDAPVLPFAHLNLRRNPFGEPQRHERGALAVVDVDAYVALLRGGTQRRHAVQFIGECGRGKTTHMLALHRRFAEAPYVYVPEDGPCPDVPAAREGVPVFVDEMQRMPWRVRREVMRRGGPLVIGTHRDHTRQLRRHGYDVTTVRPASLLTMDGLRRIVRVRIEWARRDEGPVPTVTDATLRALMRQHGDDVRAIEGELYETFQHMERITDV